MKYKCHNDDGDDNDNDDADDVKDRGKEEATVGNLEPGHNAAQYDDHL